MILIFIKLIFAAQREFQKFRIFKVLLKNVGTIVEYVHFLVLFEIKMLSFFWEVGKLTKRVEMYGILSFFGFFYSPLWKLIAGKW